MIPLTTEQYAWGFVSGRISALEGRLLGRDFYLGLLAHSRSEDIFRQLQDTALGAFVNPGAPWDDCSALIDAYFHSVATSLRQDSPHPGIADLFLIQGDYLNLKRALVHAEGYPFPSGTLPAEKLSQFAAGDLYHLEPGTREAVRRLDEEAGNDAERRQLVDVALDGAFLRHSLAIADDLDVPLIRAYVETSVFARAILALWRALRSGRALRQYQHHFLPLDPFTATLNELVAVGDPAAWAPLVRGDLGVFLEEAAQLPESEQAPRFEQLAANHLARLAERGRGQAFGPERVFAYLVALALEAYNLKVVVCGRLNRIDAGLLRQRLREAHA